MKYIECKLPVEVKVGEAEWTRQYLPARLVYTEANEAYAAANAENGVYTIVEGTEYPEESDDSMTVDDMAAAILEGVNDV